MNEQPKPGSKAKRRQQVKELHIRAKRMVSSGKYEPKERDAPSEPWIVFKSKPSLSRRSNSHVGYGFNVEF